MQKPMHERSFKTECLILGKSSVMIEKPKQVFMLLLPKKTFIYIQKGFMKNECEVPDLSVY